MYQYKSMHVHMTSFHEPSTDIHSKMLGLLFGVADVDLSSAIGLIIGCHQSLRVEVQLGQRQVS
jgi:hypothetical protein